MITALQIGKQLLGELIVAGGALVERLPLDHLNGFEELRAFVCSSVMIRCALGGLFHTFSLLQTADSTAGRPAVPRRRSPTVQRQ